MKQTMVRMVLMGIGAGAIAAVCMVTFGGKLLRDAGQQENAVVLTAETQVAVADEAVEESAESAESEAAAIETSQEAQATEAETTPSQEPQVTEAETTPAQEPQVTEAETEPSQETKAEETEISVNLPDQRTDEETYEEMKAYLAALPDDANELAEQGCYVSTWNGALGEESLHAFRTAYRAGEAAGLVLAGYTEEGDTVFDYLKYDGEALLWVHDSTRDAFAGGGETYQCESGLYLLVFYRIADGYTYRDLVLTDDAELDYDEYYDTVWGDGLSEARIRLLTSIKAVDIEVQAESMLQAY